VSIYPNLEAPIDSDEWVEKNQKDKNDWELAKDKMARAGIIFLSAFFLQVVVGSVGLYKATQQHDINMFHMIVGGMMVGWGIIGITCLISCVKLSKSKTVGAMVESWHLHQLEHKKVCDWPSFFPVPGKSRSNTRRGVKGQDWFSTAWKMSFFLMCGLPVQVAWAFPQIVDTFGFAKWLDLLTLCTCVFFDYVLILNMVNPWVDLIEGLPGFLVETFNEMLDDITAHAADEFDSEYWTKFWHVKPQYLPSEKEQKDQESKEQEKDRCNWGVVLQSYMMLDEWMEGLFSFQDGGGMFVSALSMEFAAGTFGLIAAGLAIPTQRVSLWFLATFALYFTYAVLNMGARLTEKCSNGRQGSKSILSHVRRLQTKSSEASRDFRGYVESSPIGAEIAGVLITKAWLNSLIYEALVKGAIVITFLTEFMSKMENQLEAVNSGASLGDRSETLAHASQNTT